MNKRERNQQIEGLRGIACLLVVFHHIIWSFNYNFLDTAWAVKISKYAGLGRFGVIVFLIISTWFMVDCPWVPTESVFKETYKQLKIKIEKLYQKLWLPYVLSITVIYAVTRGATKIDLAVSLKTYNNACRNYSSCELCGWGALVYSDINIFDNCGYCYRETFQGK